MKQFFYLFLACFLPACIYYSCAQVVQPTGGPKDETPPILDTLGSTKNYQTNFKKQRLEFTFDEWVQLKDVGAQVVVSPPLQYSKTVDIRKKTIRFDFDEREVLRENATYTINFGKAIQDLTANNPTELRYVFSTGDFIDSLQVSGKIVDAFTGEPVEDILLMLYDNLSDTVVRTEKPFYFGRSDKSGNINIKNVRADTFKVFVLEDNDLSLTYSSSGERIAFLDSFLVVNDSTNARLEFRLSQETEPLKLLEEEAVHYGHFNLEFNRKPEDVVITKDEYGQFFWTEVVEDSLHLWYNDEGNQQWFFYVENNNRIDTILVEQGDKKAFVENTVLSLKEKQRRIDLHNASKPLELVFTHPLASFDSTNIQVLVDTTLQNVVPKVSLDSLQKRTLIFQQNWRETLPYKIKLLPNAVTDIFGISNQDTIILNYKMQAKKDFGNLLLTIDSLDASQKYVAELLGVKDAIITTFSIENTDIFKQNFMSLPPSTYTLRIIEDTDGDGRWSPANYDLGRQPERIFTKQLEELRANWDVEATISLKK